MKDDTMDTTNAYPTPDEQMSIVKDYFKKVGAGDPTLLDLFTDDAQAFFPKRGVMNGKAEFVTFVQALGAAVSRFFHDRELMVFTQGGNRTVVEGLEVGELADGTPFPGGAKSGGRFCNVFEFRGSLISRMHVYADPDLAGKDNDLVPWS